MTYRFFPSASRLTRPAGASQRQETNLDPANTTMADQPETQGSMQLRPIHPSVLTKLDPAFVAWYNKNLAYSLSLTLDLNQLRLTFSTQYSYATTPGPAVGQVYDLEVTGWHRYPGNIRIRIYVPQDEVPAGGWPVHVNFHGGGWCLGDLNTDVHSLTNICSKASVVVIDVEYRLTPETPFPTAIYDCFEVLKLIKESAGFASRHSLDTGSVTIGGPDVGATIALILNHLARNHEPALPIRAVIAGTPRLLNVSMLDNPKDSPFPSMSEMAFAPIINFASLKWSDDFRLDSLVSSDTEQQEQREQDVSWFANAFEAPSFLDLAPTWIGTAECDPLRDEGEAYAKLLRDRGNQVILKRYEGVPHPFPYMDAVLWQARQYIEDICAQIRKAHYDV